MLGPEPTAARRARWAWTLVALGAALLSTPLLLHTAAGRELVAPLVHHSAARGDVRVLAALLALGADPNGRDGAAPLYAAAWYGQDRAAAVLLDHGADPERADPKGITPLMGAAKRGNDAVVRLLLEHGASAARRAPCGNAAEIAAAEGHPTTAALIDELAADAAP